MTAVNNEKAGIEGKKLKHIVPFSSECAVYENVTIVARLDTMTPPTGGGTSKGIVLPYGDSGLIVRNSDFINFDISSKTFPIAATRIDGTCSNRCGGLFYEWSGARFFNVKTNQRGCYA